MDLQKEPVPLQIISPSQKPILRQSLDGNAERFFIQKGRLTFFQVGELKGFSKKS